MIQLQISTQPTILASSTQPAALKMRSQPAELEISTEAARAEIRQPKGTLTIDSYRCRAAIGLKNTTDMIRGISQKGERAAQEATASYVQQGNRLARVSNPSNTVVQMVANRNMQQMQPLSITWANVPLPEIDYQPAPAQISWTPGRLRIQAQPMPVQGEYVPGKVDTRVTQYASISIQLRETGNAISVQT